jgi:hypothetical protein
MPNNLFTKNGRSQTAVAISDPLRASGVCDIQVDGSSLNDQLYLVSVTGSGAVNLQMDLNFNNALFVTVFGDKITPLTFKGIALPSMCGDAPSGSAIISFFNQYKASASNTIKVITVAYNKGDFVFEGILTEMHLNPYTQGGPDAFSFDMKLQGRVKSKSAASPGGSGGLGGMPSLGKSAGLGGPISFGGAIGGTGSTKAASARTAGKGFGSNRHGWETTAGHLNVGSGGHTIVRGNSPHPGRASTHEYHGA